MLKIISSACAALMVFTVPFAAPAVAMPVSSPAWDAPAAGPVIPVQRSQSWSGGGRWQGNQNWHGNQDYWWRHGRPYYRGHLGHRHYRHGHRQYRGHWFPPAAFIAGAIIGGAIANQAPAPRYRGGYGGYGNAHVEWCYARYRSYQDWDNTFQPYNGPRRQCISPYS